MRYQTFLFDFDYTLGDSTEGIVQCARYALEHMGDAPAERESIRKTIGMSLPNTYTALTGNAAADRRERFADLFHEKANEVMVASTQLYPATVRVLPALKALGCRMGIVSTKHQSRLEQIMAKFGFDAMMDVIVGCETVHAPKPSPEGLNRAIAALAADRESVLYVGDNIIDAQTAQNAGVDFAGVLTGTNARTDFDRYPHAYLESDLGALFEKLGM